MNKNPSFYYSSWAPCFQPLVNISKFSFQDSLLLISLIIIESKSSFANNGVFKFSLIISISIFPLIFWSKAFIFLIVVDYLLFVDILTPHNPSIFHWCRDFSLHLSLSKGEVIQESFQQSGFPHVLLFFLLLLIHWWR